MDAAKHVSSPAIFDESRLATSSRFGVSLRRCKSRTQQNSQAIPYRDPDNPRRATTKQKL